VNVTTITAAFKSDLMTITSSLALSAYGLSGGVQTEYGPAFVVLVSVVLAGVCIIWWIGKSAMMLAGSETDAEHGQRLL
jgi:hypothetical protein